MSRVIPRFAMVASCVAVLGGFVAASAQAATTGLTVTPVTGVTPESAVFHATIATGGVAVGYSFAYDTLADYKAGGNNTSATPTIVIPAGSGTVSVTSPAGCYPVLTCSFGETPLTPGTKYVVQLFVTYGAGGSYLYTAPGESNIVTFTTGKLGKLSVASSVPVNKGKAEIGYGCTSTLPCKGLVAVTVRSHHKNVTCAAGSFKVKTGKKGSTIKYKVSGKCLKLLAKAPGLTLKGKLLALSSTDQRDVSKSVTLTLV